jgi:hypothetical protein
MLRDLERKQAEERQLVTQYDRIETRLALMRNLAELDRRIQNEVGAIAAKTTQVTALDVKITAEQDKDAGPFMWESNPPKPNDPLLAELRSIDTSEVVAPEGTEVVGLEFYQKFDRLAPRLVCRRLDSDEIITVENTELIVQDYIDLVRWPFVDLGLIQLEIGAALVGRLEHLFRILGFLLGDEIHVLEHGQRRIDHPGTGGIIALGQILDRLDQLIAVTRLVGDQLE